MIELPTAYEKLSFKEAEQLNSLMRAKHGNVKACVELSGLNVFTLNRARNGLDITKQSAKAIRNKLLVDKKALA